MNLKLGLVGVGILGLVGCASTGGRVEPDFSGLARTDAPSIVVGEARVLDSKLNPLVPVRATAEDGSVMLRFSHPRHAGRVARLEPSTMEVLSIEAPSAGGEAPLPRQSVTRIALDDGRFIACWKHGDAESGYRAIAQAYRADGTPIGSPTVISPPDVDVVGVPQLVTTDGRHVLAAFAGAADNSFELLAVPLEDARGSDTPPLTARR
jgi:hypothetical protein